MKRLVVTLLLLLFTFAFVESAQADWRWAKPPFKQPKAKTSSCKTTACKTKSKKVAVLKYKLKVAEYHLMKQREWDRWAKKYIPTCTWYGESGPGPEFAPHRYTMPNSTGSGAFGKFQFMPPTYFSFGRYDDWSPLDQEIAARQLFWAQGTSPWEAC
jgi:hypothetical protein